MQILKDRQAGLRGHSFDPLKEEISTRLVLRPFLFENRDVDLADLIWNYFEAISDKWPKAWASEIEQNMLNRTNGYNTLMKFFGISYLEVASSRHIATKYQFEPIFPPIEIEEEQSNTKVYVPGTSGAVSLYRDLLRLAGLTEQ